MSSILSHPDYLEIHPLRKCVWVSQSNRCKLCPEIEETYSETIQSDEQEEKLLLRIEKHLKKGVAPVFVFRTSFNENKDRGLLEVEKFAIKLKRWFDGIMILEMLPTPDVNFLDHAYGIGVDAVIINLAVYNPNRFTELFPRKEDVIGYPHYWEYFSHAAKVFPKGAVFSQLIPGAEHYKDTRAGVKALLATGVVPFLDLFGPRRAGLTQLSLSQKMDLIQLTLDEAALHHFPTTVFRAQKELLAKLSHLDLSASGLELSDLAIKNLADYDLSLGTYIRNYRSCFSGRMKMTWLSKLRRKLRVDLLQPSGVPT